MDLRRIFVIFKQNVRLVLRDPGPIFLFILVPLLVMAVIKPTQEIVLLSRGFPHTNGSEQVVPGFTVMFAFFWMMFIGRNFFAEHGWGTWERLQATAASGTDILVGKVLPAFVIILGQAIILFTVGTLVFDLNSQGPMVALLIPAIPLVTCVLALTLALVALCRTLTQIDSISNALVMLFACIGGPLAPIAALPRWAETISPATPSYWAIRAADKVILKGEGVTSVLVPALVLLLFTALFASVAGTRFRFAEAKAIEAA